jgi:hypothetical protein
MTPKRESKKGQRPSGPPPLDPPEREPERLLLSEAECAFAFWGWSARVELCAEVLLRYITEPPHGDPLYALVIDGRVVGNGGRSALFFAGNVRVSRGRELIALLMYGAEGVSLCAVHLTEFRAWCRPGLARIDELDERGVTAAPFRSDENGYGAATQFVFPPLAEWSPAGELPVGMIPAVAWTQYRL